ncbi:uncharacterized protein LOC117781909 [Drosophila innubila]|uniref:uncharacterized protein LOC117781909 n=1 Tax=Drosophila innubila TaxID=198719 RepID=UPI00148C2ECB|nr:uncharacterized protein LOC117781909 [Drosophila innubila]
MPLKAVCIELRPNLCSGHVFLQFEHDLGDSSSKTRVVIKEHDVHIVEDGVDNAGAEDDAKSELVIRHASFGMDIQQISVFMASGQHISFRFNYTHIDLEALQKAANMLEEPKSQPLLLSFAEREDYVSLHCSKCLYELVPSCSYKRLREFPSGLVDPSEFFCHNHGTTCKSSKPSNQQPTLVPGSSDLYYGLNHIVLNIAVLESRVINSSDHLYCKRCMQMLGLTILKDAAAKLWSDALRWLPTKDASTETTDTHPSLPRQLFQHSTVTQMMLRLLSNLWTQSMPQFCLGTSRALLMATMPNRQQQYMLIHVLERQLAVLRRIPQGTTTEETQQLHYFRACKLYFRVFDNSLDELEQQMDLPRLHISPYLFLELQERLNRNSQLIPRAWRYNSVEEKLLLTYFFYENEQQEQQKLEQKTPLLVKLTTPKKQSKQKKPESELKLEQEQEEYETDAGLDASLDEDEDDEEKEDEDETDSDSDDEHSDTDSETSSTLLHKSAPIREYEQNLVKRWLTQRQSSPDSKY